MAAKPLKHTRKKKLGNYPHTMVIFSITLALFVIGSFGLLLIHASKLSNLVKQNIEVQVYLDREMSPLEIEKLRKTLARKEYIAYEESKPQVIFMSKEEGAKEFIDESGEDFLTFLGENPLRDAFILRINPEFATSDQLKNIKIDLQNTTGIHEVDYVESLIDSINHNLRRVSIVLLAFAGILVLVVIILINNTIKLALYSQRFLIRSMQLVGATSFFIQRPFLNRATFQGLVSGALASLLLFGLLQYAYHEIAELYLLRDEYQMLILMASLLILGGVLGFFSSYRAVKKYLRASLDDLY
ncbi:cell division protein FtsX [Rufibacter glacialis]|uniref:Cell division protein FtsX n=1 Tax=Rufibacter glacialis TaxID=1259555 RepID=A0A5M8QEZ1_9BACT|nr:permease-like cell division protein FtsX [Rufibacter glacialis]KAA6434579.1 ABC transporter permease [Rufibacter glacialis]GGK70768.1 cell division protein FtsX [Rufibacter glacialis]